MSRLPHIVVSMFFAATLGMASAVAQPNEPIEVEVGKAKLIRMEQRPQVIFIGNPAVVDIVIEQDNLMFLVGRQTGETDMRFLDSNGVSTMNVSIVVVPQEARHITLNRGGRETTFSCNPNCAGVRNPHAAGASVGGGATKIPGGEGQDSKTPGQQAGGGRPTPGISPTVSGPKLVR